jgi:hypothetical protein
MIGFSGHVGGGDRLVAVDTDRCLAERRHRGRQVRTVRRAEIRIVAVAGGTYPLTSNTSGSFCLSVSSGKD